MVSVAIKIQWQTFWCVFEIKVCSICLDKQSFHVYVSLRFFSYWIVHHFLMKPKYIDNGMEAGKKNRRLPGNEATSFTKAKLLHKKQLLAIPTKVNDPFANALQSKNVHNGSVLFTRNWSMYQFRWYPDHFFFPRNYLNFQKNQHWIVHTFPAYFGFI